MSTGSQTSPSREEILAASQRRLQTTLTTDDAEQIRFEKERDTRQMFRRLLDPGILRGVEKKTAMSSMKAYKYSPISLFVKIDLSYLLDTPHHFRELTQSARQ